MTNFFIAPPNPFMAVANQLNAVTQRLISGMGGGGTAINQNSGNNTNTASIFAPSQGNAATMPTTGASGKGGDPVQMAMAEIGKNEADGSYKKFSQGREEAWCADFVSYIWEKANGGVCPWGYNGDKNYKAGVIQIKDWAEKNGNYVKQNDGKGISPGDLITFGSDGGDHIGMVKSVDPDGTVHTVEGNTSDKVAERTYKPGDPKVYGFIKMDKYKTGSPTSLVA